MQNWSIPPQSVSAGDSGESVQPSAPSTTQPPDQPPATAMSPSHPPPAKTMPTTVHPPATPLSGSTRPCPRPAWPACPRSPPAQPVHPSTKPHKHRRPSRPSTGELPCCRPLNLLCLSLRLSPRGKKVWLCSDLWVESGWRESIYLANNAPVSVWTYTSKERSQVLGSIPVRNYLMYSHTSSSSFSLTIPHKWGKVLNFKIISLHFLLLHVELNMTYLLIPLQFSLMWIHFTSFSLCHFTLVRFIVSSFSHEHYFSPYFLFNSDI